jgi:hypothetical protein
VIYALVALKASQLVIYIYTYTYIYINTLLGKALVAQGKTEAAEAHLERLLAYYPNDEVLRYWHSKAAFEVPSLLAFLVQQYKYSHLASV